MKKLLFFAMVMLVAIPLAFSQNATIIPYVWDDLDGDGKQDGGEPAIVNAQVELWQGGNMLFSQTTDVSGTTTFTVPDGTSNLYLKFFKFTGNYAFTLKDQGQEWADSDADRSNGKTVTFTATGSITDIDCGQWSPGTINAYVWDDLDGDGKQDGGEPGIAGATVELWKGGNKLGDALTDAGGIATIPGVPADQMVYLKFIKKAGNYAFTHKNIGQDWADSDADRSNGKTHEFKTTKGAEIVSDVDAGQWSPGTVKAFVWDDLDGDGKQDGGEPGIENAKVQLWKGGTKIGPDYFTDVDGFAQLYDVPADEDVYLKFHKLNGLHAFSLKNEGQDWADSDADRNNGKTHEFKTTKGAHLITDVDCGEWSPGYVETFVWDDLDGDGKQDGNEPGIDDITVELWKGGSKLDTQVTDGTGTATLVGVPADEDVYVKYILPSGDYAFTLKNQGQDWADSDADRNNGKTPEFKTTKGAQTISHVDAGMWSPGFVDTFVWDDQDGDGKQDGNEPGIDGVTVELWKGGSKRDTKVTDADGKATLEGVPADQNVYVKYLLPSGDYAFTLKNQGQDWADSDADRNNGKTPEFKTTKGAEIVTHVDGGMWSPGTVITYVWNDTDGDGKQDGNEYGLPWVKIRVYKGGSVKAEAYTDVNGIAVMHGVPADENVYLRYYTRSNAYTYAPQDQGQDWIDSDANTSNGKTIEFKTTMGNEQITKWDCGMNVDWNLDTDNDGIPDFLDKYINDATNGGMGSILAYAWDDQDGNGKQSTAEPSIGDVKCKLRRSGGYIEETTFTHPYNGLVAFFDISLGSSRKLDFDLPNLHAFAEKDQGSNDNIDSDVDRGNGETDVFAINNTNVIKNFDAGLWSPGNVKTFVWNDLNGNGKQDGGELGVAGVTVKLRNPGGYIRATTTTNANGIAMFNNIVPADQNVKLDYDIPGNYAFTEQNQGSNDNIDSDADRSNGNTGVFKTTKGNELIEKWDAGVWAPGSVTTFVWNDRNGNGKQDTGEEGVANITVKLRNPGGNILATTTTDFHGEAVFTGAVPADHNVKLDFDIPGDHAFTQVDQGSNDNIDSDADRGNGETITFKTKSGSEMITKFDAGVWKPGSVTAFVWDDLNGNGKQDGGEDGVENVVVRLRKPGGYILASTTTDVNGEAILTNAVPADQNVMLDFDISADYAFTLKDQGSNDNIDSDADRGDGKTVLFKTSKGSHVIDQMDAGVWLPGSIETFVWNDLNGNGKQDGGEPGVAGVTVKLRRNGNYILDTQVTNGSGVALFDSNVPADQNVALDYDIPGGYAFTILDAGSNDAIDSDADPSNNGKTILFKTSKGSHYLVDWDAGVVLPDAPPLTRKDASIEGSALEGINVYPNPANQNAEVKIEYTLETSVIVQAVVFNSTGMKVANLTEGLQEEGQQTLTWNTKDLKSGLYMIRMLIGDELHVKNVVVK